MTCECGGSLMFRVELEKGECVPCALRANTRWTWLMLAGMLTRKPADAKWAAEYMDSRRGL